MTRLVALAVGALLFAATALVSTAFVQYSRNTLARNGRWISAKSGMQMALMGANHFMHTRNALQRDSLNLHAWHGHNELDLNEVFEPQSIELRFRLADAAHLEVLFNRDERGYDGLRLSRSGQLPSMLFHADRRGSFTARRALDVDTAALVGDGWHRLELRLGEERLQGRIDSRLVIDAPVRRLQQQFIGLRGGSQPAVVDWVRVREAGGRTVIDESFSNSRGTTAVLLGAGVVYFAVYAILAWFMLCHGERQRLLKGAGTIAIVGTDLLLIVLLTYGFDYFIWSGRYPYCGIFLPDQVPTSAFACSVERFRSRVLRTKFKPVIESGLWAAMRAKPLVAASLTRWTGVDSTSWNRTQVMTGDDPPRFVSGKELKSLRTRDRGVCRLAYLGTSQTVGAGAETVSDTFVAGTHRLLAHRLAAGRTLESMNFAVAGSNSGELVKLYTQHWAALRPDLLVVNLSNNDGPRSLELNLTHLLEFNARERIATVLLLEANSSEIGPEKLGAKHRVVERLASEWKRPVWDLDGYLASDKVRDSGFLWWDFVHMTSWGHEVTAGWLAERIGPDLVAACADPGSR